MFERMWQMKFDRKIYTVTDLGPGDGGKGGVVHKISHMQRAHTIVKVGGAQGSHGVSTSQGDSFAFSQFGCGTFEGVRTHLTPRFIAAPEGILNEGDALYYGSGIRDVYGMITIDESTMCATPFHGIASRIIEIARGNNSRGTIGSGVGQAYRSDFWYPELTIFARDLASFQLRSKIEAHRDQVALDLEDIIQGDFLPEDIPILEEEVSHLNDPKFIDYVVNRFAQVAKQVRIVDGDYFRSEILGKGGIVVVESSHGILTDHLYGFHPHTSAIRTLPRFTHEMLESAGYDGEIINLGVSRAYQIRHGAGPMPTADPKMSESLLPGSHKIKNRYQGEVRVGPLDLVMLRYAIDCCGGPSAFDGLAITWFDQIQQNGSWKVSNSYSSTTQGLFSDCRTVRLWSGQDIEECQLDYQQRLGEALHRCRPVVHEVGLSSERCNDRDFDICAEKLRTELKVDVRMVSFGPTEQDKYCK